ncbi:ATP-binding protein [Streptomyces coeruleoprunus]|uniref:ATP-binding protein n=1 Tax=Streptomyces coeruleoprunus TaxID=285563 RepID=A0ABV9XPX7_9ACTN
MKQSAAKSLGVAALGAAFAVSAAGSAAAATAVPTGPALDTVSKALAVGETAELPGGAGEALAVTRGALDTVSSAAPSVPVETPVDPVMSLLGGLPLGNLPVGGSLPAAGLGG